MNIFVIVPPFYYWFLASIQRSCPLKKKKTPRKTNFCLLDFFSVTPYLPCDIFLYKCTDWALYRAPFTTFEWAIGIHWCWFYIVSLCFLSSLIDIRVNLRRVMIILKLLRTVFCTTSSVLQCAAGHLPTIALGVTLRKEYTCIVITSVKKG